jgi:zinc protease
LTATLLDDGTKTRSRSTLPINCSNRRFDRRGSGWDSTNVSMSTLTKNMDQALDIFADVIVNPTFPESELETFAARARRQLHSAQIESERDFRSRLRPRALRQRSSVRQTA